MEFEKIDNSSYKTGDIKGMCLKSICEKACNGASGSAIQNVFNKVNS